MLEPFAEKRDALFSRFQLSRFGWAKDTPGQIDDAEGHVQTTFWVLLRVWFTMSTLEPTKLKKSRSSRKLKGGDSKETKLLVTVLKGKAKIIRRRETRPAQKSISLWC